MMRPILIGLSLAAAFPALAQQPRSVEYFIMHNGARQQMLQTCFGGIGGRLHDAECINANQAGAWLAKAETQQRIAQNRHGVGSIDSPLYYDANPFARNMVLNQCAHPDGSFIQPTAGQCQAARMSLSR